MSDTQEPFPQQNDHLEETEQPDAEAQPEQDVEQYPVSTLPPPESDEAHGGPLGCCLGVVAGLFLTMLLMLGVSLALSNGGFFGIVTVPIALLGGGIGGYFGWRVGRAIYRVYEPPVIIDKRRRSKKS